MKSELRTYRLVQVDTLLPSGRLYPNDVVEKAIAQCKKPFYIHYDVKRFNIVTKNPEADAIVGMVERIYIEKGYMYAIFSTGFPIGVPDLWDREPNSLSILPVAVGIAEDRTKPETISDLTIYSLAISTTNINQFSKFIRKSRIIFDPMIRI